MKNNKRTILIVGAVLILLIFSLFIPTIRQGNRILNKDQDKDVVYADSAASGEARD